MSQSRNKHPEREAAVAEKRSGRVVFDSRGNSVWEWQVKTGVYSTEVNTERVRTLDLDGLSLVDTAMIQAGPSAAAPSKPLDVRTTTTKPSVAEERFELAKAGGGFNPYDNSAGNSVRSVSSPGVPTSQASTRKPVVRGEQASVETRKLSGWLKLKRALTGKG